MLSKKMSPPLRLTKRLGVSLMWEPRDVWVGLFWKPERHAALAPAWHFYVCLLPMVVLHFVWMGDRHADALAPKERR